MSWKTLVVCATLFCSLFLNASSEHNIAYFDDEGDNECKRLGTFETSGSAGLIVSHREYGRFPYRSNRSCVMNIFAPLQYRVRLRALDFDDGESQPQKDCEKDMIYIFDRGNETLPVHLRKDIVNGARLIAQYCGKMSSKNMESITSSKNALSLWWYTEAAKRYGPGFRLLWTAFRKPKEGEKCNANEFTCGSSECIPRELACDQYANCEDGSDTSDNKQTTFCGEAFGKDSVSGWAILLLCLGAMFGVLFCVICCGRLCRFINPIGKESFDTFEKPGCVQIVTRPLPPSFYPPHPPRPLASSFASTNLQSMDNFLLSLPANPRFLRPCPDRRWPTPLDGGSSWKGRLKVGSDSDYTYVRTDSRRLIT